MKIARPAILASFTAFLLIVSVVTPVLASAPEESSTADESSEPERGWPREIVAGELTFVVYEPQLDSWDDDNVLEAHAAVAVREKAEKEGDEESVIYGVVSYRCRAQVDKSDRLVTYVKIYESSPEMVSVGYTPGYYGTVVSDGVVVYGTGYTYSPWAGTSGNVYSRWGSTAAVTRRSGGYNSWTGTGFRNQVGASYNSRTGTLSAGQRGVVGNVYSGDYAYGKRGVAGNREAGLAAGGKKITAGNTYSGREVTAGKGAVYNRNTGELTKVRGIRGEQGGVGRVGNNVYGRKDGSVYKRTGQGSWEQLGKSGSWGSVRDSGRASTLDRQYRARSTGQQRSQAYSRSSRSARSFSGGRGYSGGGRMRGGGGRRR